MRHLTILASDEYEGRESGLKGQKLAAAYIQEQFEGFGIPPVPDAELHGLAGGYQQPFELAVRTPGGVVLHVNGEPYRFLDDLVYFSEKLEGELQVEDPLIIAAPNELDVIPSDQQLSGRVVLFVDRTSPGPGDKPSAELMKWITETGKKAEENGAKLVLLATPSFDRIKDTYANYLRMSRMELKQEGRKKAKGVQVIVVSPAVGNAILQHAGLDMKKAVKKSRRKRLERSANCTLKATGVSLMSTLVSENVLGFVKGSEIPDEVVVVTAHYDHIGVQDGEVYNGADDDGSGTVALLEMAEAFSQATQEGHGPRRSILFMPVSAEEKGLLGSEYYSQNPVFPLENTVANLNIDMIGRFDSAHATSAPYVYIIGSDRLSKELHELNESANERYVGLDLDYTFNAEDDPNRFYYRSDHYNFARKGIPCIFYFSGVHEDYHGPGDEAERIISELLEMRTRLVFHTAWELANRPQRVAVDIKEEEP
ncbi:MAG: M28 family peptidase [Flavobacteriales bacterium]|nr:M28 family peptidase [Flavobacteriales bacterium]